jgi:hypothetical protein
VTRHLGNAAVLYGDIAHLADAILGIHDVAALEQQIVWRLRQSCRRQKKEDRKFHEHHSTGEPVWWGGLP